MSLPASPPSIRFLSRYASAVLLLARWAPLLDCSTTLACNEQSVRRHVWRAIHAGGTSSHRSCFFICVRHYPLSSMPAHRACPRVVYCLVSFLTGTLGISNFAHDIDMFPNKDMMKNDKVQNEHHNQRRVTRSSQRACSLCTHSPRTIDTQPRIFSPGPRNCSIYTHPSSPIASRDHPFPRTSGGRIRPHCLNR